MPVFVWWLLGGLGVGSAATFAISDKVKSLLWIALAIAIVALIIKVV